MRTLSNANARFADDHGEADPITREALSKVRDHTSYVRALVALCSSRLLMPIVASGDETDGPDPNRQAEMAAAQIVNDEGAHLLAFTGLDAMQAWQADARPVPCTLDDLCATVKESGADRLLIDCAGPTPLVIAGEALDLFAQGYAIAEFEGGEFAWVRYDDASRADDEAAQQVAQLESAVERMGQLIAEAEAAAAQEEDGAEGQKPAG